jgi:hypothetical protein
VVQRQRPFRASPAARQPRHPLGRPVGRRTLSASTTIRSISVEQIAAVRAVMQIFIDDDRAKGMPENHRMHCDACQTDRGALGFIQYERDIICNDCAIEYEVARLRGLVMSAAEFVRDKRFGDGDVYALERAELV